MTTPFTAGCIIGDTLSKFMILLIVPRMITPIRAPTTFPPPPARLAPPIVTAAIESNRYHCPAAGCEQHVPDRFRYSLGVGDHVARPGQTRRSAGSCYDIIGTLPAGRRGQQPVAVIMRSVRNQAVMPSYINFSPTRNSIT